MKMKLLPLAIAAAVAAPGVALAEATVYGKMNVSLDMVDIDPAGDADDYDQWELNSYDSRLGVKGEEKISDSLTAFYTAEYGINVDDGGNSSSSNTTTFSQRNIFVGMKGGWGAVQLGKFDTPLKVAQGKIDQFGDTPGDIKNAVNGENRSSDLIQYTSPKFADAIVATIAVQPGEDVCDEDTEATTESCNDGLADGMSASVAYDANGIYVAVAHDSAMASNNPGPDSTSMWDTTRLVGAVNIDQFEIGALYQTGEQSEPDQPDELDGFVLSAGFKLGGPHKLKAQYGASELTDGATDETTDITLAAFGYENALSKQTKLYVHYVMLESEEENADESDEATYFQLGVDHKF